MIKWIKGLFRKRKLELYVVYNSNTRQELVYTYDFDMLDLLYELREKYEDGIYLKVDK
jgi:hypothetical protein